MACLAGMLNLLYEPTTTPMHPAKNLFRIKKRHLLLATITLLFAGRAMAQSYFTVSMSGADKVKFNTGLSGPAFGGYLSMGYGFAHQVTNPVLSTGVANAGTRSHKMITFAKGVRPIHTKDNTGIDHRRNLGQGDLHVPRSLDDN